MGTETPTSDVIYAEVVNPRAVQAYEMLLAGKQRSEVAAELGYDSTTAMGVAISTEMKRESQFLNGEARTNMLQMELDRLDRLYSVYYPLAMQGSLKDAELCLHITDRRIKVGQLDAIDTATQGATVLVIGGNERAYIDTLKELAE